MTWIRLADAPKRVGKSERTIGRWIDGGMPTRAGMVKLDDLLEADRSARARRGRPKRERPTGEPTMHERYPEVAPFVVSMYEELAANAHKGDQAGWRLMTLRQAWGEISWHSAKLAVAIKSNDDARIREYAADVANGCMMLVDILNHGEVDRCPHCGFVTTAENDACAWHAMRAAKGEVPDESPQDTETHWANGIPRLLRPEAFERLSTERLGR